MKFNEDSRGVSLKNCSAPCIVKRFKKALNNRHPMSELVFSIANTFSLNPQEGVLGQSSATSFFIAPYQRGYKWSSETTDSPVQKLLFDLSDAFSANLQEYYLQYITLSESRFDNLKVLEVIDGQQRLTTLTLLFSVLSFRRNNRT